MKKKKTFKLLEAKLSFLEQSPKGKLHILWTSSAFSLLEYHKRGKMEQSQSLLFLRVKPVLQQMDSF